MCSQNISFTLPYLTVPYGPHNNDNICLADGNGANYLKSTTGTSLMLQRIHICTYWGFTPEANGADCTVSSPKPEKYIKTHWGLAPLKIWNHCTVDSSAINSEQS